MTRRERLQDILRPWFERCGIALLSRPGLNHLDRQLAQVLSRRGGWFVEAGANDGFCQSNTYYLARFKGWRGVLVEPVPELAASCRKRRPESQVYECVLGPPELTGSKLKLRYAGLMTGVCGALADAETESSRAAKGLAMQGLPADERFVEAPVRTLTEVLVESGTPAEFDLLSLDVEGYEPEVLKGLDLNRFRPRFMCLELRRGRVDQTLKWLDPIYSVCSTLHEAGEHADYLLKLR